MGKIIRLTESELIDLVKSVVSERFEIMGELMGRAENFLRKNGIDSSNMDENEIFENIVNLTQSDDGRTRHIANRLRAEMIGYFGRSEHNSFEL